jgi:multidrug efflux pump subunit AcrA (membrane-fusion protein)
LGTLEGTVVEVSPGADPASHSFQVKIGLEVPNLPSGGAGRASIAAQSRPIVVVPADAVLRHGGLTQVVVRNDEGLASSRVVTVGDSLPDGRVEILSGLSGGETVLLGLASPPPAGTPVERT